MLLHALTIFLSAFLLFQVQPLIGKYLLPWFGGGPGVWTTCLLFFQALLLGRLRLRPPRHVAPATTGAGAPPPRAAGRVVARPAHHPGRLLETRRRDRTGHAYPPSAHGLPRPALRGPFRHRPVAPALVQPLPPGRAALAALRALQRRLAAGVAELSVCLRAAAVAPGTGLDVVGRLRGVRPPGRRLRVAHAGDGGPRDRDGAGCDRGRGPVPARPLHVACPAGGRLAAARGDDQPALPRHRRRAVPVDRAARALPAELHPLLRPSTLV